MRKPYSVVLEDLAPELRRAKEVVSITEIGAKPSGIKEVYIAELGAGKGLRWNKGKLEYDGAKWMPTGDAVIFVVAGERIVETLVVAGNKVLSTERFLAFETNDRERIRIERVVTGEFSMTSLAGYFRAHETQLGKNKLFAEVIDRTFFRFFQEGYYAFYIFWVHGLTFPNSTKISDASIFIERGMGMGEILLDTVRLKIEIATGVDRYLRTIALQGYWLDWIERDDVIRFSWSLNQDLGGEPLSIANNSGQAYIIFERIGGTYGGRAYK